MAAAALLIHAAPAGAQQTGPLPAAAPSDAPPPPPQSSVPKLIGNRPNIGGTWALNKDDSDDPRQAMRDAMGTSGGGNGGNGGGSPRVGMGGGGGGMGGGGWGGRGGAGNGGSNSGGRRSGQSVENPAGDLSQLTIDQTATSATVLNDAGRVIAQYPAGSTPPAGPTMKNSTPGASSNASPATSSSTSPSSSSPPPAGGASSSSGSGSDASRSSDTDNNDVAPNAQWKGSQFVAVTPGRRQGSTTRTYELSPDGRQLYVTTQIDNPRFQNPVTFRLVYDPVPSTE
jgi:hypothetical protein